MSQLFVDDVVSKEGTNSVGFSKGISVSVASTFSGDVSIGGTLTYEDVTNIDAVGLITARGGIKLGAAGIGGTFNANGDTTLAGVVTATTFVGNLTGNPTGSAAGLTNIPGGQITGALAAVDGSALTGMANTANVNTAGLNVIGVTTAVGGIEVGAAGVGGTITSVGNAEFVGIVTAAGGLRCNDGAANGLRIGDGEDLIIQHNGTNSFIDNNTGDLYVQTTGSGDDVFVQPADALYLQSGGSNTRLLVNGVGSFTFDNGTFIEKCNITAGKLSGNQDIDLLDGMVHYFSTQETTTAVPNLRESASRTLGDAVNTGDIVTVNIITTAAAAGYSAQLTIDSNAVTEEWIGGSAPSAGSADGLDIYVYTCIRIGSGTGDSGWKVIANVTNATN